MALQLGIAYGLIATVAALLLYGYAQWWRTRVR